MTDFYIIHHGSVVSITPISQNGWEWLIEYVGAEPWQWIGNSLVIDYRTSTAIIDAIEKAGLIIE